ncbi:GumC family protein [Sediminibacterium soli]|uniref:GumC family protein n=1 Tax=Sediminibacterium soli TaxID=2698829 RepID=UPI00137A0079|nr:AAA family ATPase [Sediminibacterium soli]NCI45550.1 AAA family ATPase [Sediminibacterium soli]
MIDLGKFMKMLSRYAFILIAIPVVTVAITYFLVRQLPNEYVSKARIATGLVEQSEQILDNLSFLQESRIDQEFSNIMQVMQLKRIYDQVSYQLILHDITKPDSAFRRKSDLMNDLNKDAIRHAIQVYSEKYAKAEPLVLWDRDQAGLKLVLVSMGYDEESLKSKIAIYRVNRSDYIDVEFRSDNPLLSAFVVNQLTAEFIRYYASATKTNQVRSMVFLDSLRKNKQAVMDLTMEQLKSYKIQNRILNLDEQARVLYGQIADIETKLEVARKDVEGYNGVLRNIDSKFDPNDKKFIESTTRRVNQDIVNNTNQLKALTEAYIRSNYDPVLKIRIDSLRNVISGQITESADRYTMSPLTTKENLLVQKINAEVGLDMARHSIQSLQQEVVRLNKVVSNLVPHEANVQAYEEKIDVASKEYLDALNKFNQASLSSSLATRIRQIEYGMPGSAAPSKKMLLVILSGVISFAFCVFVLFILFYIDSNIKTEYELASETGHPVLGTLPFMGNDEIDLKKLWNGDYDITRTEEYKNMIRSIRFEISEQMGTDKLLAITSIKPEEGKTFVALNIAYAYSRAGKKVLVIDGHFDKPDISQTIPSPLLLEDYLTSKIPLEQLGNDKHLAVLASRPKDISLFEIVDQDIARQKLQALATRFDMVIIDTPSLRELSKSKEWIVVADKTLAVYEAGYSVTPAQKQQHIKYLNSINGRFIGWLMNKVVAGKARRKNK